MVHLLFNKDGVVDQQGKDELLYQVTTRQTHILQPEVFGPRTWRHNLRIFHFKPNWMATVTFYKETFQCLLIPNVFWLLLLNGTFLGLYVYQASTFAQLLAPPPHSFTNLELGYVQVLQSVDCMVLIPILGYGVDYMVRTMSRLRKGVFLVSFRQISFR